MRTRIIFGFLAVTLALGGCGGDDDDAPAAAAGTGGTGGTGGSGGSGGGNGIEIEGTWTGEFQTDVIDDDSWSSDFGTGAVVSAIAQYSNEENVAITQNPDDAEFDPGLFNRNVWTEVDGDSFFYCTTDFGLDTEDDAAESDTMPDASDPENGGCGDGDFPWTQLTRD